MFRLFPCNKKLFIIYCRQICHLLCNFLNWSKKRQKKDFEFVLWLFLFLNELVKNESNLIIYKVNIETSGAFNGGMDVGADAAQQEPC